MRSHYYHIVLSEKSRPKSAFISSFGKWEFKKCPFGLVQTPVYFQRLVNEVLSGLTFAFGYLDDILVYSPDMETHLEHLGSLFIKLRETDLKLKEVKCSFLKKHIQYLGHIISPVKKAFSEAKGILTLVPLLKIDEIYARLKGSNMPMQFTCQSKNWHITWRMQILL